MLPSIHYAYPKAIWIAPFAFLLIALLFLLFEYRRRIASYFGVERYRDKIMTPISGFYAACYALTLFLVWQFATLALMQPEGKASYGDKQEDKNVVEEVLSEDTTGADGTLVERRRKAHDVIFLLDTSASMDVTDTPQGISRLQYAKEIVDEIVAGTDGAAVGLYAFTSEVTPLVPPTYDSLFFRLLLRQVSINEGDVAGTDLASALEEVAKRHLHSTKERRTTVVLLTDGGDTRLETLSGSERERELEAILSRLEGVKKRPVRLFTVGLGSSKGAKIPGVSFEGQPVISTLDEELLQKLAEKGNGQYFFAENASALTISRTLHGILAQDDPLVEEVVVEARDGSVERTVELSQELSFKPYFQWPLAVAVFLLAMALLLPERRSKFILSIFLCFSTFGYCENLSGQWRSAAAFYQAEDYAQALEVYDTILNSDLSSLERVTAELNRAHVLALQGRYDEAIEQVRQAEPDRDAPDSIQDGFKKRLSLLLLRRARASHDLDQGIQDANEAIGLLSELPGKDPIDKEKEEKKAQLMAFAKGVVYELKERQRLQDLENADISEHAKELEIHMEHLIPRLEGLIPFPESRVKEQSQLIGAHLKNKVAQLDLLRKKFHEKLKEQKIESAQVLFDQMETHYRSAIDALNEGRVSYARTLLGSGRLGFGFFHRATGEGVEDPVNWLLQQRIEAESESIRRPDFTKFYKEESQFSKESLEKIVSGLALEEEDPWRKTLFEALQEHIQKIPDDPVYDQLFYQGIGVAEPELLLKIHTEVLLSDPRKPLSQEIWDRLKRQIQVVEEMLYLKEEESMNAAPMLEVLSEAKEWSHPPQAYQLAELIERALLVSESDAYLIARLKRLETSGNALQKLPILSKEQIEQHRLEVDGLRQALERIESKPNWSVIATDLEMAGSSESIAAEALYSSVPLSRFFLSDSLAWLQSAREQLEPPGELPQEVLNQSIEKQQFVLKGSENLGKVANGLQSSVDGTFFSQQKRVLDAIDRFAVPEETAPKIPWTKIKLLVSEGRNQAQILARSFETQGMIPSEVKEHATNAITSWQEALKLLQDPPNQEPPSESPKEPESSENNEEQDSSEQQQEQQQQTPPDENLIQAIQQMEQEDSELFQEPERAPKKGLRPW